MPRLSLVLLLLSCCVTAPSLAQQQKPTGPGHYLFVWAGDYALQGNDFLAVIDADPASAGLFQPQQEIDDRCLAGAARAD